MSGGRKTTVVVAGLLAAVSAGTLAWVARAAEDPVRAVRGETRELDGAYARAASQAQGLRVLVIHDRPGAPLRGEILESARGASGWELLPAVPPGAEDLAPVLADLAERAAADWEPDARLAADTSRALGYLAVQIVLVERSGTVVRPELDELDPLLGLRGSVPGIGVRKASPVLHLLAEPKLEDPGVADPDSANRVDTAVWASRLRAGDGHFESYRDRLWGGSFTLEAHVDGDYLLAWPVTGARVEVDGKPVTPGRGLLPLIRLTLAAGRHEIRVTYLEAGVRGWVAAGAAAGLVLGLLLMMRAFRPDPGPHAGQAGPQVTPGPDRSEGAA